MQGILRNIFNPFFASLTMLTKFNLPFIKNIKYNDIEITNSVLFFPVIGLIYGIVLFYANQLMIILNISVLFKAAVILSLPFFINNFFHFDGLCDILDGFLVNKDINTRLKILKDTNIGSYALGGSMVFMLFKYLGLLSFLTEKNLFVFLIMIPVYSRFIMVLLSYKSIYPRESGTASLIVGKISGLIFTLTCLIFLIIISVFLFLTQGYNCFLFGFKYIAVITITTIIFYILFKIYSYKKIGGITGDVLGAACEASELIIIFTVLILNKWFIK